MARNSTSKKYGGVNSPIAGAALPSKTPQYGNTGGSYEGEMNGNSSPEKFGKPMQEVPASIKGLGGTYNDIGELSGFITDGYLDKGDTPYGEACKFNFLPPGMDISNQENAEIHDMPLRKLTSESYPGDGWMPAPRDIPE
jgi:hypothetical protein